MTDSQHLPHTSKRRVLSRFRWKLLGLPVVAVLGSLVFPARSRADDLSDGELRDACGPIAMYAALIHLGEEVTLSDVRKHCNWQPGKKTKLSEIHSAFGNFTNISVATKKISPSALNSFLSKYQGVAIIAVRKGHSEINHVMTVIDAREDAFVTFDYPELLQLQATDDLVRKWDGVTLLAWKTMPLWSRIEGTLTALVVVVVVIFSCLVFRR